MKIDTKNENLSPLPWMELLKNIWKWVKPYRVRFIIASILRLLGDIAHLYPPLAMATIITFLAHYTLGKSTTILWTTFILMILTYIIRFAGNNSGRVMCYFIGERISMDVQLAAARHLFGLSAAWHEKENTGNKLKRMMRGGDSYEQILRIWINNIIEIVVNFIGVLAIVIHIDPLLAGLLIIFGIIYYSIALTLIRPAARAANEANIREEEYGGLSFEALNNIRSIQVYGSARVIMKRLQSMIDLWYEAFCKRMWKFTVRNISLDGWQMIFRSFSFVLIIIGITKGWYEVGLLIAFNLYFYYISESVRELADASQQFVISRLAIQRLNAIMQERPVDWNEANATQLPSQWRTISFRNISFSYGNKYILNNVSFDIKRGERIGIVGLSGAGKSTLLKLLMKEREDYEGDIFFDTLKLRSISRTSYFEYVAVVLQETEVFNFPLKDNISISRSSDDFNEKAFKESIATSHITDFLHKLPRGIDTLVGEKGVKLSGGEKQRLGIARAIYKQPDLLLLDEATSHLDLESEEKIQDSLHHFFKKVTAIVIAHRLTTIKEMDRIIVLEDGRIIEEGTFTQLQRKKGRFHELWEKQKL